jgi:hypothetical protein
MEASTSSPGGGTHCIIASTVCDDRFLRSTSLRKGWENNGAGAIWGPQILFAAAVHDPDFSTLAAYLWCVRTSKCSRESLLTCGERRTQ